MDSAALSQMLSDLNSRGARLHSLLIVRNGHLVTEAYFHPYNAGMPVHIQSVTKSVIGALTGIAIGQGLISSADARLLEFFPGRLTENMDKPKETITIKHLLSMSSGLPCQDDMLDLPLEADPGEKFIYCNGSADLISVVLGKVTGMTAREYANQELFAPLGIPPVATGSWMEDSQHHSLGGYGLYLRPRDLAKIGLLYLHNGRWAGRQVIPAAWVADSTTQRVVKENGTGYGYLWTVYPKERHYAALGLGGQQIHVYPDKNLVVVVTADLDAYAESPLIEEMLANSILPSIRSTSSLPANESGLGALKSEIQRAANPVQSVPPLPETASAISGKTITFSENPMGWQTASIRFSPNDPTAQFILNGLAELTIGLDNIYRVSPTPAGGIMHLRGRWINAQTFVIDYPYALIPATNLADLGDSEFRLTFRDGNVKVEAQQSILPGEPFSFEGTY